jgi:hypothetical protein
LKNHNGRYALLAVTGVAGVLATSPVSPQSGGGFNLTSTTLDNGGGRSAGGSLVLNGTIGQLDATSEILAGGSIRLAGGFLGQPGEAASSDFIFSNGFESE